MQGGLRGAGAVVLTGARRRRYWQAVQRFIDDAYETWRPSIREWNAAYPSLLANAKRAAASSLVHGAAC